MRTVWKFPLKVEDLVSVSMPKGSIVLAVEMQGPDLFLWAYIDTDAELVERRFRIAGTGHPLGDELERDEVYRYANSFQMAGGSLVFHVFETVKGIGDSVSPLLPFYAPPAVGVLPR